MLYKKSLCLTIRIKIHNNIIYKGKINMATGISKAENDSTKFLQV